jgi:hypothetical protein
MTASLRCPTRRRWWPAVTAAAVLAIGISLLWPAGRHQWALSLIRQPTPYTVLSFNEAWTLPATAVVHQPIKVSFTVGNHEGRAVDYRYVLRESSSQSSRVLKESARMVAANATWTVSVTVRLVRAATPCHIEVSLPGHPETIDFLVALKTRGRQHG